MSELAIDEMKILRDIAKHQEDQRLKIKGWLITLVTALSIAYLTKKLSISALQYVGLSLLLSVLFLWLDVVFKVAQNRALKRCADVENYLRVGAGNFDGPLISVTLSKANTCSEQLAALNNVRVYGVYVLLAISVSIIGLVDVCF